MRRLVLTHLLTLHMRWIRRQSASLLTVLKANPNNNLWPPQQGYLEGAKGAKIDSHKVSIATYHEDEIEEMKYNSQEPITEPIPEKYNSKTTLKADVVAGANVFDFELESK